MRRLMIVIVVLGFGLAACFRDAASDSDDTVSVDTVQEDVTPDPTPTIAAATLRPSNTPTEDSGLPVGGPPSATETPAEAPEADDTEDDTSSEDDDDASEESTEEEPETTEADDDADSSDLPPTRVIPSFTPAGSTFGDPGVTPTNDFATQQAPGGLVTPTEIPTEIDECVYIVQQGDTLFAIAEAIEADVEVLLTSVPNPDALSIGQEIQIPGCVSEADEATAADDEDADDDEEESEDSDEPVEAPEGTTIHVVQEGENLFRIALQYNVTEAQILALNPDIPFAGDTPILQPGQTLIIPAGE